MDNYIFYIYNNKWIEKISNLTMDKAIQNFESELSFKDSEYVALGVYYEGKSCNLIVKYKDEKIKVSNDYLKVGHGEYNERDIKSIIEQIIKKLSIGGLKIMSKDKLYELAKKIDDINYEYDIHEYMNNLDTTTSTIEEARKEQIDKIYYSLLAGYTKGYIYYLNDIIDDIEGIFQDQVREVLKQLQEVA